VEQQRLAQHASSQGQSLNPFLRRPTRPMMMWDTGSGAPSKPAEGSEEAKPATTTTTAAKTMAAAEAAVEQLALGPVEVVDTVDVQPQQAKLRMQADAPIVMSTATKKFSLADYKKMKQQQRL
jgi:hypothetical protein